MKIKWINLLDEENIPASNMMFFRKIKEEIELKYQTVDKNVEISMVYDPPVHLGKIFNNFELFIDKEILCFPYLKDLKNKLIELIDIELQKD